MLSAIARQRLLSGNVRIALPWSLYRFGAHLITINETFPVYASLGCYEKRWGAFHINQGPIQISDGEKTHLSCIFPPFGSPTAPCRSSYTYEIEVIPLQAIVQRNWRA